MLYFSSILRPRKFRGTRVVQKACLIQDERVVCGHLRERSADNSVGRSQRVSAHALPPAHSAQDAPSHKPT